VTTKGQPTTVPVTLTVTPEAVHATAANGDTLALPLAALEVTPGGYDGDFVFLRAPGHDATITTVDLAVVERLAEVGGPAMAARLGHVRKHRSSASLARKLSIAVASAVALALGALVLATPAILSASIDALPTSLDREIGDAALADLEGDAVPVTDPRVVSLVEAIVARLREVGPPSAHTYRVAVVANDEINAFALPGGQIVVWTGLVEHAESAEQIAGVLAHEIAHVERRHGMRNVVYRAGIALGLRLLVAILIGGDLDGLTGLATDVAALAVANEYGQDQESEADADAVLRMHAAGLDPTALAAFFRVMSSEGVGDVPAIVSWLSTHPDHASRIAAIEARARALPALARRPLEVDLAAARAALE
jgi:predicted Zn-dependent protease